MALTALKGNKTLAELAQQFDVHPNQITDWKKQLQERVADVFEGGSAAPSAPPVDGKVLHAKIGQLTLENDFLESAQQGGTAGREAMIDPDHALPVTQQARLVGISRSSAGSLSSQTNGRAVWNTDVYRRNACQQRRRAWPLPEREASE